MYNVPRTGAKYYFYTAVDSKSSDIVKNYTSAVGGNTIKFSDIEGLFQADIYVEYKNGIFFQTFILGRPPTE